MIIHMCIQIDRNVNSETPKMVSSVYRNFSAKTSRPNDYFIFTESHTNKNGITAKKTAENSNTLAEAIYDDRNLDNLVDESGKLARSVSGVKKVVDAVIFEMSCYDLTTESFSLTKDIFVNNEETQPKRAPQLLLNEANLPIGQKREEPEVEIRASAQQKTSNIKSMSFEQ